MSPGLAHIIVSLITVSRLVQALLRSNAQTVYGEHAGQIWAHNAGTTVMYCYKNRPMCSMLHSGTSSTCRTDLSLLCGQYRGASLHNLVCVLDAACRKKLDWGCPHPLKASRPTRCMSCSAILESSR